MSSEKAARVSEKKRLWNRAKRRASRTHKVAAERLIQASDLETAASAVRLAISVLDRTAQKGTIHRNTAARYKSRLMAKLNQRVASEADSKQQ